MTRIVNSGRDGLTEVETNDDPDVAIELDDMIVTTAQDRRNPDVTVVTISGHSSLTSPMRWGPPAYACPTSSISFPVRTPTVGEVLAALTEGSARRALLSLHRFRAVPDSMT